MIHDLDDGERAALVALRRRALDDARYPLALHLAPLKAVLGKLEPPAPAEPTPTIRSGLPPPIGPGLPPRVGRRRRR